MFARPWIFTVAVLLTSQPAFAEDEPYVARRLAGHRFAPSSVVDWGFVDSWFRSSTVFGLSKFEFDPSDRLARLLGSGEVEVIAVGQRFTGSAAFTPWLAATLNAGAFGVIPGNGDAAFQLGASELLQAEAAAVVRLFRHDRVQMSARAELGWGETRSAIPARLPTLPPYLEGDVATIRPSVIAAVTLAHWLGIQASGSYAWRRFDLVQDDDVQTIQGAAAATFAIPNVVTFVVGFQLAHDFNRDITSAASVALYGSEATRGRLETTIYYQGRADLDLGLGFAYEAVDDDDEQRGYAYVNMGYYF